MKKILKIEKSLANKIQEMINTNNIRNEDFQDGIYKTFTIDFGNNIEADIKVCIGDDRTVFIDPVLFDNGSEVCLIDVSFEFLGEYIFKYANNEYIAKLV